MSNARKWECDLKTYHADTTAVSHSGLDLVLDDPALYRHQRLLGNARESKPWFEEGQNLEDALLGGNGEVGSNLVVIPKEVLASNGARAGTKWKEFEAANAGKVLVKEGDPLINMVDAVLQHDAARELFTAAGTRQETIIWHEDRFGVDVRCRFDFLHYGAEVAVDLKSTRTDASPRECANECAKFGYYRQDDLYCRGSKELYGVKTHFIFVFVAKDPPHRVETFELDDEFKRLGQEENDDALATYAECRKTGVWLPKTHGRVIKLSPPGWVRYQKEWRA